MSYETLTGNIDAIAQRVWMSEGYPVDTDERFLKYASIQDWEMGQYLPAFASYSTIINELLTPRGVQWEYY